MKQQVISPYSEGRVELPVELVAFSANVTGKIVIISWQTATELNNRGFEIQRKSDKNNWQTVGFVKGKGTTAQSQFYSFSDNLEGLIASGKVFYRLKIVDFNGSYEYSTEVVVDLIPQKFELAQNYPNPFNPSTTISWQSPISGKQTLKVFDLLGKEVESLIDEYRDAGSYSVEFNASNFASGIYFYRLQAGNYVETKKMVLMK